jgi:hypothetical protein
VDSRGGSLGRIRCSHAIGGLRLSGDGSVALLGSGIKGITCGRNCGEGGKVFRGYMKRHKVVE